MMLSISGYLFWGVMFRAMFAPFDTSKPVVTDKKKED